MRTSLKQFRIGTWNLDRSGVRKKDRIQRQIEKLVQLNADVLVLTETHSSVALPGYTTLASDRDHDYHLEGESYAAIWSRFPLKKIKTQDPIFTVCAEIQSPVGVMLIYGTIITYGADGVREGLALPWERHRLAVRQQATEWQKLKDLYPDHLRCVAGDFNMNLDEKHWYGVRDAKEEIREGLDNSGLNLATKYDLRLPPYNMSRATVDHICLSPMLNAAVHLEAWEGTQEGVTLSDHNGVLTSIHFR